MTFREQNDHKVLLALLPFWDPLNPPLGISSLKSYLRKHGYRVATRDLNTKNQYKEIYDTYFAILEKAIPPFNRSNFYNIGKDVFINHLTAHIYHQNEVEYIEMVKILAFKIFYIELGNGVVSRLVDTVGTFYTLLEEDILHLLETEKPTVLGLSVFKGSLPASLFAFKLAKTRCPHTRTVMGGGIFDDQLAIGSPDLTALLEKASYIDHAFIGEGELLLLEFLRGNLPEGQRVYSLADLKHQTLDLSVVDIPDFSDLDLYPQLASYGSRSCPFNCKFCSETIRWGKYRKKNPDQVAEELVKLYKTYGNQLFLMGDSLLNPICKGLAEALLKQDVSVYWDGYFRVDKDSCVPEITHLYRKGGFYRARLGVESGSQHVLDLIRKAITVEQIKEAVIALARAGIKTTTYWLIGFPGETEEDFLQTLDIVKELKNYIYEAETNPYWYYPSGQVGSDEWSRESYSLYPEHLNHMLMFEKRELNCEPSREERYRRMAIFEQHIKELGIPNIYSWYDILRADKRWKKLHKNAVPAVCEFKEPGNYIDENKCIKQTFLARGMPSVEGDWGF